MNTKTIKFITLTLTIVILAACQAAPTPTAISPTLNETEVAIAVEATVTAQPGQAPTPTAPAPTTVVTPEAGSPAYELGPADVIDTFDSAVNFSPKSNGCFTSEITGGQFIMAAKGLPGIYCWKTSWSQIQDFFIQTTTIMPDSCVADDNFGLLVRSPDSTDGYLYGLNCAGQYSLKRMTGGSLSVLVPPTSSDAILVGSSQINRIGLAVYSGNFYLFANGKFLTSTTDYTFLEPGDFGYYVSASTSAPFTSRYNELAIWSLEDAYYPSSAPPPSAPPVQPVEPPAGAPYVTATTAVNIRSGPGTNYPIYGVAPIGASAPVTGISPDGGWYVITIPTNYSPDGTAWVSASYVTLTGTTPAELPVLQPPSPPPEVTTQPPAPGSVVVTTTDVVNVRSGPGNEYDSYGAVPTGTSFTAFGISQDGKWVAVAIPTSIASNGIGWVNSAYLQPFDAAALSVIQ